MVLCYSAAVILLIVGIGFYTGKAASFIEGYRNMPDEEKQTVKIIPLCKNISVMFFLAAVIFGIAGFSESFRLTHFKWLFVGWIVLCIADIAFINKSGLYVNQIDPSKKNKGRG